MPPNIFHHDAAVLVWLLPGQTPDAQNFNRSSAVPPPSPNPEAWWNVKDAIVYAVELAPDQRNGKVPWIKFGHDLLSPDEIQRVYADFKRAA